ncbi:MAG: tetratricopeptide repeat protein [Kofleriaceae bacterium]
MLDSWGLLRLRQGHLPKARAALVLAARLAPHEAEILGHLAEVWVATGQVERARSTLARARAVAPDAALRQRIDLALDALPPPR